MKKSFVSVLIYFMAIVIVGLVGLQYFFIRISYEEKKEIFKQHIYQALQYSTERLKSRQSVMYVYEHMSTRKQDSIMPVDPTMFSFTYPDGSNVSIEFQTNRNISNNNAPILNNSQDFGHIENYFEEIINEEPNELYQILEKMETEIFLKQQPLSKIYTNKSIQNILSQELKNQGIHQDFKYAIVHHNNIHPILKSKNFKKSDIEKSYVINLQPKAIFNYPEYLYVNIPEQKAFLMNSISMQITLSVIFVLIILITFFISSYIILRQKRLGDMKNDFISNMTHEFKTPIATIRLAADSLSNPKVLNNEKIQGQFINIISQETHRLNNQVEKILEVASLDKGDIKLNLQTHDVHEIIQSVCQTMELRIKEKNGTLETKLEAHDSEYLIDEEHMMNVISNLVDNAIKYSIENPSIEIRTYNKNKWLYIAIQDHGVGMDNATVSRIFEKFYRATTGNVHNIKGFGLGLHYVKEIINAHKGLIDVKSTQGKGSTFTIKLLKT